MRKFPRGFVVGAATSAYQVEGGVREGGRAESIWDRFSHTTGHVANGDTGDVACDHYHLYAKDIALMKHLGLQSYRFSIAWPRVLPRGTGLVNRAGLDFYDRLIDLLLEMGIQPMVTLYHWDLPQALQDKGGWTNRDTAKAFAEYAHIVFRRLGDRIPRFITLNEPWCSTVHGHLTGEHAPGLRDIDAAIRASHHLLLGHGLAVEAFRSESLSGQIGITNIISAVLPASRKDKDKLAAKRMDAYLNRWFLDPLFRGQYPQELLDRGVAQVVADADMYKIRKKIDFLGVNYYFKHRVVADSGDSLLGVRMLPPKGRLTATGWEICPQGLTQVLLRVTRDYGPIPLYVTEFGAAFNDDIVDGQIEDIARKDYIRRHLRAILKAVARGADVQGAYVWSLLDNYEWAYGYAKRFGIVYVDYETQQRFIKKSGFWLRNVIASRRLSK